MVLVLTLITTHPLVRWAPIGQKDCHHHHHHRHHHYHYDVRVAWVEGMYPFLPLETWDDGLEPPSGHWFMHDVCTSTGLLFSQTCLPQRVQIHLLRKGSEIEKLILNLSRPRGLILRSLLLLLFGHFCF